MYIVQLEKISRDQKTVVVFKKDEIIQEIFHGILLIQRQILQWNHLCTVFIYTKQSFISFAFTQKNYIKCIFYSFVRSLFPRSKRPQNITILLTIPHQPWDIIKWLYFHFLGSSGRKRPTIQNVFNQNDIEIEQMAKTETPTAKPVALRK